MAPSKPLERTGVARYGESICRGAGRYNQQRSAWDTLHPGRGWAERCAAYPRSEAYIVAAVAKHFKRD